MAALLMCVESTHIRFTGGMRPRAGEEGKPANVRGWIPRTLGPQGGGCPGQVRTVSWLMCVESTYITIGPQAG